MKYLQSLWMADILPLNRPKIVRGYFDSYGNKQSTLCWTLSNLRLQQRQGVKEFWGCKQALAYATEVGMVFDHVHEIPDNLTKIVSSRLWAFPKLYAMAQQTGPFMHLDGDVFLAKELPPLPEFRVQNQETVESDRPWMWFYGLHAFLKEAGVQDPLLNTVWEAIHDIERRGDTNIYNFGVVGGTSELIPQVAGQLVDFILRHNVKLSRVGPKIFTMAVIEQMWMPLLLKIRGIDPTPLFNDATMYKEADELGYCHMVAHHKRDEKNLRAVRSRIEELNPNAWILKTDLDYVPNKPRVTEPNLKKKVMTLASSLTEWAAAGFKVVGQEEFDRRLAVCKSCEFWDKEGMAGTGKCTKCGCSTQAKLRLSTASCPEKKWLAIT